MNAAVRERATSSDFDFLLGRWNVRNRRLIRGLAGADEWDEFDSKAAARPLPAGLGTEDVFCTGYGGGFFAGDIGLFEGDDTVDERPIRVRFVWSGVTTPTPRLEQAFSDDDGETWETNWVMDFTRTSQEAA